MKVNDGLLSSVVGLLSRKQCFLRSLYYIIVINYSNIVGVLIKTGRFFL